MALGCKVHDGINLIFCENFFQKNTVIDISSIEFAWSLDVFLPCAIIHFVDADNVKLIPNFIDEIASYKSTTSGDHDILRVVLRK